MVGQSRGVGLIVLLAIGVGTTVAHVSVLRLGPEYDGPLLFLESLFSVVLACGFFALGVSLGCSMLRKLRFILTDPVDLISFSAAAGFGLLSTLLLAEGFLGILHPTGIGALLFGVALVARRDLRALPSILAEIPRSVRVPDGGSLLQRLTWVAFGVIAVFLLIFGVSPPTDWDALMYHLEVPLEFLRAGRVFLPPDNLHASFVGLPHMLYLPLLAAGSRAGPTVLNVLLTLALALSVYRVGARLMGATVGALGMTLFWGTSTILLVAITPRTDVALAFFLFLGHYAVVLGGEKTLAIHQREVSAIPWTRVSDSKEETDPIRWISLASALFGLSVAVKFNGLAYSLAVSPVAVWVLSRNRPRPGEAFRVLLLWGAIGSVCMAPWLLKNLALFGAPLYPFLTQRVAEPWLDALFPGGSAAGAVGPGTLRMLRSVQDPFSLPALFFQPSGLNVESEGAFYYVNWAFFLLPAGIFYLRNWRLMILLGPALVYSILAITLDVPNVRYLVPAIPALTLSVAWIGHEWAGRWSKISTGIPILASLATLALYPTLKTMLVWLMVIPGPAYAVGALSARAYFGAHPATRYLAPVVEHVNRDPPPGTRTLMLFEARGEPFDRMVIQDNKISNWPILAEARKTTGDTCLRAANFDFVLLGVAAVAYYEARGLDPRELRLEDFEEFRASCLEEVWRTPGYVLFGRRDSGAGPRVSGPG